MNQIFLSIFRKNGKIFRGKEEAQFHFKIYVIIGQSDVVGQKNKDSMWAHVFMTLLKMQEMDKMDEVVKYH